MLFLGPDRRGRLSRWANANSAQVCRAHLSPYLCFHGRNESKSGFIFTGQLRILGKKEHRITKNKEGDAFVSGIMCD